jgi:ABC-type multidrug transport system ATPase subunit
MIKVQNLSRTFGDFKAVDDISFEVAAREIFAFLGPKGAGKTTTIRMLTTLLTPSSGSIRMDGLDPARNQHEVRSRFGIVFLDEPTLGLDPQSRNQLWSHVQHLNKTEGVTVFLTTHYMDEADRVRRSSPPWRSPCRTFRCLALAWVRCCACPATATICSSWRPVSSP